MTDQAIRIGIVTISDRASKGVYTDLSGPAISELHRVAGVSHFWPRPPRRTSTEPHANAERGPCEIGAWRVL